MSLTAADLDQFISQSDGAVLVSVDAAKGSTPREQGAFMLVSAAAILGTIGGGQLEFLSIDAARRLLREPGAPDGLNVPLGPEIGQCCGGRVQIGLRPVTAAIVDELQKRLDADRAQEATVYILGAGHVGRAIAHAMLPLPFKTTLIDTRADALEGLPTAVDVRLTAIPEAEVRAAPPGSAFVVLTHDHALDFLIAREALKRGDASYVGMIGSKTKLASFRSWLRAEREPDVLAQKLVCPIGGNQSRDKRPEVIAALAVAEILVQTGMQEASNMTGVAAGNLGNG